MLPDVPQRRYPFFLNHTPRTFELSLHSHSPVAKSVRFPVEAQHCSDLSPTSMTSTFSAFPSIGNPPMSIHRKPIASRQCTSFSLDRPVSTVTRRHSWTASCDILTPSCLLDDMLEVSDNENEEEKRTDAIHLNLPRPGATFDMAYFIKNTGPPRQRESSERERKIRGKKMSLGMFKRRKDDVVNGSDPDPRKTLDNFVPPERVEQKVTLNGIFLLHPNFSSHS